MGVQPWPSDEYCRAQEFALGGSGLVCCRLWRAGRGAPGSTTISRPQLGEIAVMGNETAAICDCAEAEQSHDGDDDEQGGAPWQSGLAKWSRESRKRTSRRAGRST